MLQAKNSQMKRPSSFRTASESNLFQNSSLPISQELTSSNQPFVLDKPNPKKLMETSHISQSQKKVGNIIKMSGGSEKNQIPTQSQGSLKKQNFIVKSAKGKSTTFYYGASSTGDNITERNNSVSEEKSCQISKVIQNIENKQDQTKNQDTTLIKRNDHSFSSCQSGGFSSDEGDKIAIEEQKYQIMDTVFDFHELQGNDVSKTERHYLEDLPPQPIVNKPYSLEPDMLFGWKPKLQFNGPIPLNFKNRVVDMIINQIGKASSIYFNQYKLCYIGFRPYTSLHMHQQYSGNGNYYFRYEHLFKNESQHLNSFFDQFSKKYRVPEIPIFLGNNPLFKERKDFLKFDSNFEGGNLDIAVKLENLDEYDLFMRVDSNTKGHFQWYNFKVTEAKKGQKVRFNICNFYKKKSLYMRGMRPYIFSMKAHASLGKEWSQEGNKLEYKPQDYRYSFLKDGESRKLPFCLSFEYEFLFDKDTVQIAFCIPYTFSMLTNLIRTQVKLHNDSNCDFVNEEKLCQTMSGIDVPLLTITDNSDLKIGYESRKVVLISARIHPGESNGSWMMHGFLQFIFGNTEPAVRARKNTIFKIVPMLNPDGVIIGNYRTGLAGRDLNRVFHTSDKILYPTIISLKELTMELKRTYGSRFNIFLDLHGHSVKRNVFAYGPEYPIYDLNYYKCRIIPKLLSNITDMFRFYSCIFKISQGKTKTGRAVFFNQFQISFCYTIEASNGSFSKNGFTKAFTAQYLLEMGTAIGQCMEKYITETFLYEARQAAKNQKKILISNKNKESPRRDSAEEEKEEKEEQKKSKKNKKKDKKSKKSKASTELKIDQDQIDDLLFSDILGPDILRGEAPNKDDSDGYSEGGSDSESSDEDYEKENLKEMRKNVETNRDLFQTMFQPPETKAEVKKNSLLLNQNNERQQNPKKKREKINVPRESRSNSQIIPQQAHEEKQQPKQQQLIKDASEKKTQIKRPYTAVINRKNISISKIDEEQGQGEDFNIPLSQEGRNIKVIAKTESKLGIVNRRNLVISSQSIRENKKPPFSQKLNLGEMKPPFFGSTKSQHHEIEKRLEAINTQRFCFLPEAFDSKDKNSASFFDNETSHNQSMQNLTKIQKAFYDKPKNDKSITYEQDQVKGISKIILFSPTPPTDTILADSNNIKKIQSEGSKLRPNCPSAFYALKKHFDLKKKEEQMITTVEPSTKRASFHGNNKAFQNYHNKMFNNQSSSQIPRLLEDMKQLNKN